MTSVTAMRPRILTIEGNIGAGKSTFLGELQKRYAERNDILFLLEPVGIWESVVDDQGKHMLEKFYENPQKYSFAFQVLAFSTRLKLIREIRGRLADVTTSASTTTRRLAKAEAETRRLGNVERHAAVLEIQLCRVQADLQKKTEALERVLKRKGSIARLSMTATSGQESDAPLHGQNADSAWGGFTSNFNDVDAKEMGMQAMLPRPDLAGHHQHVVTGENDQENDEYTRNAPRNFVPMKPSSVVRSRDPSPMPGRILKTRVPLVSQPCNAKPGDGEPRDRRPASEQRRRSVLRTVPSRYASPHVRSAIRLEIDQSVGEMVDAFMAAFNGHRTA